MSASTQIRRIEEASLNAWPPLQQMVYDGWLLRFADGYTRRANSVNSLYSGEMALDEKLARCERIYRDQGLPTIFKITPLVQPVDLDIQLEKRGYQRQASTSVQSLVLDTLPAHNRDETRIDAQPSPEWIDAFVQFSATPTAAIELLRGILANITVPCCFMTLYAGGQSVACGLSVLEGPRAGLFDIVTAASARGQGFGTRILLALLAWARQNGAQTAYLQVMQKNEPALRLYSKLGFQEIYEYWYRIQR